ncbi:unnamed protein product, partial [Didymodactylos carnosus]
LETTTPKSILEQLSNELLIYVFQFLSPYDLHRAVYNLNLRLNTICYAQKLYLDLAWTKYTFDYYCSCQQPFASQIYGLKLCDEFDRLTLVDRHIDIGLFTNLRALTIENSSPKHFDKILSKLHLLSQLSYLNIYSALIQSPHITTTIFTIRSLKRLILYSFDPILLHFNNNAVSPLTLEYLELDSCYMTDFLELLKCVGPNVKQMKISILYKRDQDPESIDPKIIDNLLCDDGKHHKIPVSLRRLQISFHFLPLTDFHLILRLFPHLTHLTFSTSTYDLNFISASIWHQFISINLLKLKQLQFYIEVIGSAAEQRPELELLCSFDYNNNKQVVGPVIMDYNFLLHPPLLEFYTYSQPVRGGKHFVEFYGKERHMTETDDEINIDKNIPRLKITLTDEQQQALIDQLLMHEKRAIYPNVTTILIHSQMTTTAMENDKRSSFELTMNI